MKLLKWGLLGLIAIAFILSVGNVLATTLVAWRSTNVADKYFNKLYTIDVATGRSTFRCDVPSNGSFGFFPLLLNHATRRAGIHLYIGDNQYLYECDLTTGKIVTTTDLDPSGQQYDYASPTSVVGISYNENTKKNELYTIEIGTGRRTLLRSFAFDSGTWDIGSLRAFPEIKRVYAVSGAGTLYEFDLTNGNILSTREFFPFLPNFSGNYELLSRSSLAAISYNYDTSMNELYTIDIDTKRSTLLKSFSFDTGYYSTGTFTVNQITKRAYVMSSIGTLYEFDLTNGNLLSMQRLDGGYTYAYVLEEEPVTPPHTSFWSEIRSDLSALSIRSIPSTSGNTPIKELPNGWAIEVTSVYDSNGNIVTGNGYRWYQVKDGTDGTTGWMAAGEWDGSGFQTEYLPNIPDRQSDLSALANPALYDNHDQRKKLIVDAVTHYWNDNSSSLSLYSSNDTTKISNLISWGFTKELALAIAAQESGGGSNSVISPDYGHGIMQLTLNIDKGDDPRGKYSSIRIPPCSLTSDAYKNCYEPIDFDNPKTYKEHPLYKTTFKYYVNSKQSIFSNIKDGLGILRDKYSSYSGAYQTNKEWPNLLYEGTSYTINLDDMRRIVAVKGYNGFGGTRQCYRLNTVDDVGDPQYLDNVGQKLLEIPAWFPSATVTAEALRFGTLLRVAHANRETISICSPGLLRVLDTENNVTGLVEENFVNQIPNVAYDSANGKAAEVYGPDSTYRYQVIGTEAGVYDFYIDQTTPDGIRTVMLKNMPLSVGDLYTYQIDWGALVKGKKGVKVEIDRDGDGAPDEVFDVGASVDDTVPPTTTHQRINHTIHLNADDGMGVGVSSITWSLNGRSWKKSSGAKAQIPLVFGENNLRFFATDYLGNTENTQSITVVVNDPVPIPTISLWGLLILILTLPGIAGIAIRMRAAG